MDNALNARILPIMKHEFDVAIAGGGLNGTALALALGTAGFKVALVEPQTTPALSSAEFDGRSYALSVSSVRVLQALGIWPDLADLAQPILDIKVTDGRVGDGPSPLMLAFDHAEIEEGPMGYMVEDRHLRPALLNAVEANTAVHARHGISVVDHQVEPQKVEVSLSDGSALDAAILVGCDGPQSPTAARAGIRRTGWRYDQTALVCAVSHERPHHGCAHQYFTPEGPLAILPLKDNRASIVWTERTAAAQALETRDADAYLASLRPRFGNFLGDIALDGKRFSYPLTLSIANTLIAPRTALVGDAAHRVHPIAGQGLNAGLKDVAALADVLSTARQRGEDVGDAGVLGRYQSWRRFDIATLALATDAFNRLFSNDNHFARGARDLGLGLVNQLPGLRRSLIREAAGLTGDLPRLSRGLPLNP